MGAATGVALLPPPDQLERGRAPASLWLPATIALAYVPDVAERVLSPLLGRPTLVTHSLLFALVSSLPAAAVMRALFGLPLGRAFAVSLFSIILHDAMDLLQADDRAPLWPFWGGRVRVFSVLPSSARSELVIFGGAFAAFLLGGWLAVRTNLERLARASSRHGPPLARWLYAALLALVFLLPYGVYKLRSRREDQLEHARQLLERGAYAEALAAVEEAQRWPSAIRAHRLDYIRAEAYLGLGDRARAEEHYLRVYSADPHYFWLVADLAAFYASGGEPGAVRRARTQPYLDLLQQEFSGRKELPRVLERIRRQLAADP